MTQPLRLPRTGTLIAIASIVLLTLLAAATPSVAQPLLGQTQTLPSPITFPDDSAFFGRSMTWVDIDGDGRDDLATVYRDHGTYKVRVYLSTDSGLQALPQEAAFDDEPVVAGCDIDPSVPGEEVIVGVSDADVSFNGTVPAAGAVFIYQWSTQPLPTLLTLWSQVDAPDSTPEAGDGFGTSLATGDFDGDGLCDLAVGSPEEDLDGIFNLGALVVRYGPLGGGSWSDELEARDFMMSTPVGGGDRFAEVLAAGQIDGQTGDDLIVGSPRNADLGSSVGNVWVLTSNGRGGLPFSGQRLYPTSVGLAAESGAEFGAALAVGDFFDLGGDDLVIGVPDYPVGPSSEHSGLVVVIPTTAFGPLTHEAQFVTIEDAGVTADDDDFGREVATGRLYGGLRDDLVVGARRSGLGGRAFVFRGDANLEFVLDLDQDDLGDQPEGSDWFGETIEVGDWDGDGSPELAIAAPNEDDEGRGVSDGGDVGIVHVVPSLSYLKQAELITVSGQPYLGQPNVLVADRPSHNPAGQAAFRLRTEGVDELVATTEQVVAASPTMGSEVGIDSSGNVAWIDFDQGELLLSSRGVIFEDGTPAPGGGLFDFSTDDQMMLRGSEQLFFLTELLAPLEKTLLRHDAANGTTTRLLGEGDTVDGSTVLDITQFAVSADAAHWLAIVELAGGEGVVVDGELVVEPPDRGSIGNIHFFEGGIDDAGRGWLAVDGDLSGGAVGSLSENIALYHFGSVGNLPLEGRSPQNVSVAGTGEVISIWGEQPGFGQIAALLCSDFTGTVFTEQVASHRSPFGDRGLESLTGVRLLAAGDRLDTDQDGLADATVVSIDGEVGGAPEVSDAGGIVLRTILEFDADPFTYQALIRLPSEVCATFRDGFESGDVSAWSTSTP